ncbi:N-acetyl-alpha-D-glucosaminyl L-malate synthase [bacterium HR11]|nr:N-acetyl-alpha-D-glucosaminyl L-malate synthase [bacterium HR11]
MKILVVTGIFPPDIGGPATYVPQIARALAARGHAITVLTLSDQVDHDDDSYPFEVVRLPRRLPKPWRWALTVVTILRLGRRADVLFVNGLALESVLANFLMRKPLVMKVVGDLAWERATTLGWTGDDFETFQQKRYGWKIELLKALRSWWTRRAHRVIVPSRYLAGWVVRWGVPEERVVVVYNTLEPLDGVQPLVVPLSTPVKAVTVGRLIPLKRIDQLLEAVAKVPDLGLVVVGDGPERPRLERLAGSLGVSDRVYFAGRRSREETLGLMAACDLFVLNSTHEGLPHVVLEAMALGLPVVATAVGGTPEVVRDGETGVLVNKERGIDAQLLRRLVTDLGLCRNMGEAAKNWVSQNLSLQHMVQGTETILLGCAEKRTTDG